MTTMFSRGSVPKTTTVAERSGLQNGQAREIAHNPLPMWSNDRDDLLDKSYTNLDHTVTIITRNLNVLPGPPLREVDVTDRIRELRLLRKPKAGAKPATPLDPPPVAAKPPAPVAAKPPTPAAPAVVARKVVKGIVVDKAIPLPPAIEKKILSDAYPFEALEVGESFLVEDEKRQTVNGMCIGRSRALKRKFTFRAEGAGFRVWRTD